MAVRKRKIKRFVIDVNCFISIFINGETQWLSKYIIQNKIEIFIDQYLLDELQMVLEYPRIKKFLPMSTHIYTQFIQLVSTKIDSTPFHIKSPDPKDDYLYDIALSAHAKLLVTGERALLNWKDSPVETISLAAFKKLFH